MKIKTVSKILMAKKDDNTQLVQARNGNGLESLYTIASELNAKCRDIKFMQLLYLFISFLGSIAIVVGFRVSFENYQLSNYITLVGAVVSFYSGKSIFMLERAATWFKKEAIKRAKNEIGDGVRDDVLDKFCEMCLNIDGTLPPLCSDGRCCTCYHEGGFSKTVFKNCLDFIHNVCLTLLPGVVIVSSVMTLVGSAETTAAVKGLQTWDTLTTRQKTVFEGIAGGVSCLMAIIGLITDIIRCCQFYRCGKSNKLLTPLLVMANIEALLEIVPASDNVQSPPAARDNNKTEEGPDERTTPTAVQRGGGGDNVSQKENPA